MQNRAPDWDVVFRAAGLDRSKFTAATPPGDAVVADMSIAWMGRFPSASNTPVRIEAASLHGQITEFEVRFPWSEAPRRFAPPPLDQPSTAADFANIAIQIGVAFLGWVNWKRGRADVRSALRLGVYAGAISALSSLLAGVSTLPAFGMFVFFSTIYVAVEPWSRRLWAHAMVTWTRVLGGRFA